MHLVPMTDDLPAHVGGLAHPRPDPRADRKAQLLYHAGHDSLSQLRPALLHPAADEDDAALPIPRGPPLREVLLLKHVDALKDEHTVIPLDVEHPFDPKKVCR